MELEVVTDIRRELEHERRRLKSLKSAATDITRRLDGLPHAKTQSSRVETLVTEICAAEERITALELKLVEAAQDLTIEILSRVAGTDGEVLVRRYVTCEPFEAIAAAMGYSASRVYFLHRRGKDRYTRAKADVTFRSCRGLDG